MCFGVAPLICFAVLSTLTITHGSISKHFRQDEASKWFEVDDIDTGRSNRSNSRLGRSSGLEGPRGSFLAGEDTPVWVAYYADPNNKVLLTYKKLEKGIVKQAVEYWKSTEFKGLSKGKRSVDDNLNTLKDERKSFLEREDTDDARTPPSHVSERLKRKNNGNVYHPSVLVIAEYGSTWPSDSDAERTWILERIIYILAYWNSIDIQLRPIEDPWVRLRLAGIIIGRDRDETHHLFEARGNKDYLHYEGTLQRMNEYWGDKMRQKVDFQRGTYNIIALMTDEKQVPEKSDEVALSTDGIPCNHDNLDAIGIIVTYDNLQFTGIQKTLQLTARMLGHGSKKFNTCRYKTHWHSRAWNTCNLDSIREGLESNGWCMKEPPAFHDPGKPVEKILPGSFMSFDEQCKAIGPYTGDVCPGSSCRALVCRNQFLVGQPCVHWRPAIDGTACETGLGNRAICLDGKCVSEDRLVNEIPWW